MLTVYCVEDDEGIRELVVYALKNNGFDAAGFEDAKELYISMEEKLPDLLILDIMLPGEDGYGILNTVRKTYANKDIPVIMLTAKDNEYDKVKGLDMGADDYMTKPFGIMELISRVKAVLRRRIKAKVDDNVLKQDGIILDIKRHIVISDSKEIKLTFKEFELLHYLLKNKGIVLSRDKLMIEVWGIDFEGESRTVDVHIRTLRLKLGNYGKSIKTIRNVGYKIGG